MKVNFDLDLNWNHLSEYMDSQVQISMSRRDMIQFVEMLGKKMDLGELDPKLSSEKKMICWVDDYGNFAVNTYLDVNDFNFFHFDVLLNNWAEEVKRPVLNRIHNFQPDTTTWETVEWVKKLILETIIKAEEEQQ